MLERQPKLYFWPGNSRRKAVMIFDSDYRVDGERTGFFYVYEEVAEGAAVDLDNELRTRGQPAMTFKVDASPL